MATIPFHHESKPLAEIVEINTTAGKVMRGLVCAIAVLAAILTRVLAQDAGPPRFDAATIKPSANPDPGGRISFDGPSRLRANNVSLKYLIMRAYGLRADQVVGAPDWASTQRFDVLGSAGGDATSAVRLQMLRTLLVERFKLVTHEENRLATGWSLVVERKDGTLGPALHPCADDCRPNGGFLTSGRWTVGGAPMSEVTTVLQSLLNAPVTDATNLTGRFAFNLEWQIPDGARTPGVENEAGAVVLALRDLGLKLESSRVPVTVLVVDSVQKPSPN